MQGRTHRVYFFSSPPPPSRRERKNCRENGRVAVSELRKGETRKLGNEEGFFESMVGLPGLNVYRYVAFPFLRFDESETLLFECDRGALECFFFQGSKDL